MLYLTRGLVVTLRLSGWGVGFEQATWESLMGDSLSVVRAGWLGVLALSWLTFGPSHVPVGLFLLLV